jgi:hypothetical protein
MRDSEYIHYKNIGFLSVAWLLRMEAMDLAAAVDGPEDPTDLPGLNMER